MTKVKILDHPLIQHKISLLRDKTTDNVEFGRLTGELAMLLTYEATRDLPLVDTPLSTPIADTVGRRLYGLKPAVVPILRAGLGMVEGVRAVLPTVKIGHIGLYRDEETLNPIEYYYKMPSDINTRYILVVDPMLATGGSACDAVQKLKSEGAKQIKFLCLIASPEGVDRLSTTHPDVEIYAAALDERLNDKGYIVPGLGDAGDRIFGTD